MHYHRAMQHVGAAKTTRYDHVSRIHALLVVCAGHDAAHVCDNEVAYMCYPRGSVLLPFSVFVAHKDLADDSRKPVSTVSNEIIREVDTQLKSAPAVRWREILPENSADPVQSPWMREAL